METTIGYVFFILLLAGLGCLIYGSQKTSNPQTNRSWQKYGLLLEGAAFFVFGATGLYFSYASPKLEVTGTIHHLRQFTGKYAKSQFDVRTNLTSTRDLFCDYNGSHLTEGAAVNIRFIQYDGKILDVAVLSGENQGWSLHESSQSIWSGILALLGVASWAAAWWQYRKSPSSIEDESKTQETDTNEPDPGSLLNLH
jgi:hypothetical protein